VKDKEYEEDEVVQLKSIVKSRIKLTKEP